MRLKELRNKAGMTQAELAKKIQVTSQTILNWENNIYEPKISQLILLADVFKVTVDYLIGRDFSRSEAEKLSEEIEKIPQEEFVEFIRSQLEKMIDKK